MSDVSVTLFVEIVSLYTLVLLELVVWFSMFSDEENPNLISFVSSLLVVIMRGACQLIILMLAAEGAIKSSNAYYKVVA